MDHDRSQAFTKSLIIRPDQFYVFVARIRRSSVEPSRKSKPSCMRKTDGSGCDSPHRVSAMPLRSRKVFCCTSKQWTTLLYH